MCIIASNQSNCLENFPCVMNWFLFLLSHDMTSLHENIANSLFFYKFSHRVQFLMRTPLFTYEESWSFYNLVEKWNFFPGKIIFEWKPEQCGKKNQREKKLLVPTSCTYFRMLVYRIFHKLFHLCPSRSIKINPAC